MSGGSDFGLVGLAVMGQNLVLNAESRGWRVSVFNRTPEVTREFVARHAGKRLVAADTLGAFVDSLARPRRVMLMVKAGSAVDAVIEQLLPLLAPGDIVIDGGNSLYADTERRSAALEARGLHYLGTGVSGGEEGARKGPSIMPGGTDAGWQAMRPIFESIAARVGPAPGEPCVMHIGPGGAGHYVKMVHNGIEYSMMQGYAEGFELMAKSDYRLDLGKIADVWMHGSVVRSWLLELAVGALKQDPKLAQLKGYVQDSGEGRWMIQDAIDKDVPVPTLTAALFTRFRSRQEESFAEKMLAALRNAFGGHSVRR